MSHYVIVYRTIVNTTLCMVSALAGAVVCMEHIYTLFIIVS